MLKWFKKLFTKKEEVLPAPVEVTPSAQPQQLQISMNDFLKEIEKAMNAEMGGGRVVPFTTADSYSQVQYEMESIDIESEYWSDADYIETLLEYVQRGYKFEGLNDLYRKLKDGKDLSQNESDRLKDWYRLVSIEVVYDV
jgi:hypothetical protein